MSKHLTNLNLTPRNVSNLRVAPTLREDPFNNQTLVSPPFCCQPESLILIQSNVQDCCSNPIQSNTIQYNPSIIRQLFPHYQYQRTLKGKFDLCQVWNLGPLSQVLPLTAIHIPSNHSGHQCHQQHYQEQQQDPQESKIFCETRALAVFDRDRLVGRYRRYHSIVDKHRAVRRRMVSLRASSQCDDTFEVTDAISLR